MLNLKSPGLNLLLDMKLMGRALSKMRRCLREDEKKDGVTLYTLGNIYQNSMGKGTN